MVAELQRFVHFQGHPNSSQCAVLLLVFTVLKSDEVCDAELQKDSKLYLFIAFIRAGCAQREGQFPLRVVGEQGDEQVLGESLDSRSFLGRVALSQKWASKGQPWELDAQW